MQVLSVKVPFSEAAVSNHDARHLNLWVQNSVTIYDCTSFTLKFQDFHASEQLKEHQDGRVVKALDLRSNGHNVLVGSNPTPGISVNGGGAVAEE